MTLLPLALAADPAGWTETARAEQGASPQPAADGETISGYTACAFCGVRSGAWQQNCDADAANADGPRQPVAACPLCALSRHLERPRIDEEAILVWCPEMSQAAINVTLREIHRRLRLRGDGLHADDRPARDDPARHPLYHARAALALRAGDAASRLGSSRPSDLGRALLRLSPAMYSRRASLLGGVRLLPLGCFFVAGEDVYPRIVDTWLGAPSPRPERSRLGPMSWLAARQRTAAAPALEQPDHRAGA